jgi:hypothetical protein
LNTSAAPGQAGQPVIPITWVDNPTHEQAPWGQAHVAWYIVPLHVSPKEKKHDVCEKVPAPVPFIGAHPGPMPANGPARAGTDESGNHSPPEPPPEDEPLATPEDEPSGEPLPEDEPLATPDDEPSGEPLPEAELLATPEDEPSGEPPPEAEPLATPEDEPSGEPPPETEPLAIPDAEPSGEPPPEAEPLATPDDEPSGEPPSVPKLETLAPHDALAITTKPRKITAVSAASWVHEARANPQGMAVSPITSRRCFSISVASRSPDASGPVGQFMIGVLVGALDRTGVPRCVCP